MSRLHKISGCDAPARRADVVFIHGLGGDPFGTWRHGNDQSTSFPHWIGKEFPDVGVWSLGYASSPTRLARLLPFFGRGSRDSGHTMALPDRASQVLDLMSQVGLGERPILFICHSLGGLVLKQILRKASDTSDARKAKIIRQTQAVLFLATPHTGATLASCLHAFQALFGTTVSIEDLRAHDAHLRDLYDWYRDHSQRHGINTVTYFELRDLRGLPAIVNPSSSHPGVGADPVGLDEDHLSIAKPRETDAQVCGAVRVLLHRYVLAPPATTAPALVPLPPPLTPTPAPSVSTPLAPQELVLRLTPDVSSNQMQPRVPREMPPAASKFFGRAHERKQVAERLRAGLNTAVTGLAGFGKTALAAHALTDVVGTDAAQLAASQFPDGLVYLDLYNFRGQAEPAWSALANRLRGPEYMELRPPFDRATEACRGRRILVIIEGGEEADGGLGRTNIRELFSVLSPENRWLLLSRVSSQSAAEETVRIQESLNPDDAGALLDWLTQNRPLAADIRKTILELLEGHPLALNWAGNLLALDEEDPASLVLDWKAGGLSGLSDPRQAEHTLKWLFARSVRGLQDLAERVLSAAGLLAHIPLSLDAIATAVGRIDSDRDMQEVRKALRDLVKRGLLRRTQGDSWQFSHVLGYRFARDEDDSDPSVRERLGHWLRGRMTAALEPGASEEVAASIGPQLDHAAALLRTDPDQRLWTCLAQPLLYEIANRLERIGRLDLLASASEAVAVWLNRLPEEQAQQPYWLGQRCTFIARRGDVLRDQGNLGGALMAYSESLTLQKHLAEANPTNSAWQQGLSICQERIGGILQAQGDLTGALAAHNAALRVRQRLAEADMSNELWQRELSVALNKVGEVLQYQGDLSGALTAFNESLAIRNRLVETDPSNAARREDLTLSRERIGDVLRAQGDLVGALTAYKESLAVRERLTEADPSNSRLQRGLSLNRERIGDVLQDQGDLAGALAAYSESLATRQRLAAADPSNAVWQRELSVALNKVGDVLREQDDFPGALRAYNESLTIRQRLAEADPSNAGWQRDLSLSRERIGAVLRSEGDLTGALMAYRESLAVKTRLTEADPSNAMWQYGLSVTRNNVGVILQKQGDLAGALEAYGESMAVCRRLVEADPSNASWLRGLSFCLSQMAMCYAQQETRMEALRLAEEALMLDERLAALDGSNTTSQNDLAISRAFVDMLRRADDGTPS